MSYDAFAEQVRRSDYERYVTVLFASMPKRQALWVLYAFNCEINRIHTTVTEPMMGLVRFQWWRDAIAKVYEGQPMRHDISQAIHAELQKGAPWKEADFIALIDAYETEFRDNEKQDIDGLLMKLACPDVTEINKQTIRAHAPLLMHYVTEYRRKYKTPYMLPFYLWWKR